MSGDKNAIIELEYKFWAAIRDDDVKTATSLMAEPSIIAGAQGVMATTREGYAKMASGRKAWELHDFKLDEIDVQFAGRDAAVIGYMVTEDMTVDGKKLKLEAADTSTGSATGTTGFD